MPVRRWAMAAAAGLLVSLAGCTETATGPVGTSTAISPTIAPVPSPSPTPTPTSRATTPRPSPTVSTATPTRSTVTLTRTRPGTTITMGPPPSTREPTAVEGDCPYLSADVVSDITGQHHGPTQIVAVTPYPICQFYRSDGGWMASVRIVTATSAAAAVAAVNQHVPIDQSLPADQPPGWSGGSKSVGSKIADCTDCHSWYAVAKGRVAVITEENETPSIKARSLAVCAIADLKLQAMTLPDYCVAQ